MTVNALRTAEGPEQFETTAYSALREKITQKEARVGVVGLGYVGLPLALTFSKSGFPVIGIEADSEKVEALRMGESYITDITDEEVREALAAERLRATIDWDSLQCCDVVAICVPTPLRKTKDPDLSYVLGATREVARRIHKGQLIILESTTYPGTTEELVLPRLQKRGLKVGQDFFLAYSPERVDPGNKAYATGNIPKVVGGVTDFCSDLAALFYEQSVEQVHRVSCSRVAEMVKLLENTFRSVNIALVNELALMCHHMDIDVWETIRAAATKPFGFMPFYPGPGLGGHCIPIDPIYLEWKARMDGFESHFIALADKINSNMPRAVALRVMDLLNDKGKALRRSRVHILGVTYKKDIADTRESPALEIFEQLRTRGTQLSYTDPFVPELEVRGTRYASEDITPGLLSARDLVLIVTDHSAFDYHQIARHAPLVFDTRNATRGIKGQNVYRL